MDTATSLFPRPRTFTIGDDKAIRRFDGIRAEGDLLAHANRVLSQIQSGPSGTKPLRVECRQIRHDSLIRDAITGIEHNEGYRITAIDEGRSALLEFAGNRGLRYGLTTVVSLVRQNAWRSGLIIEDAPRFPIRGIIEGYYGPPWLPEKRRGIVGLMAHRKMNAYFYGPKDDTYHRALWRGLYPEEQLDELRLAADDAREFDMDFWYTIGPGLSMQYSDETDFAALEAKLVQVSTLGIRHFGLLFDDIPEHLQHEADLRAFASLPEAHAVVANRLYNSLSALIPDLRFVVCPTQYHGAGTESYITELGHLVDPRIEIFWTGPAICSRELTLRDAAVLERTISRPVLYWDNYPVNDCEMIHELHIGPYRGRDPHLYRAACGVVANGMEYPESSKIGLLTVADYLWNPEAYDPEESWDSALRTVIGERDWVDFKVFADNNRYSMLYPTDSPYLSGQLHRAEFLRTMGRSSDAVTLLAATVGHLKRALELFDRGMENVVLQQEIRPWIDNYRKGIALLEAHVEAELTGTSEAKETVANLARVYAADRTYVFADVLNSLTEE
ncbi:MAG: beta-N-acetylglucosaminidase domain-containing protein [Spirochaetaceae bacterium]|nr:beta-N-acetylglucosaminidase domain-containing protein [Spirochaetaceae bacterium]